MLCQNEVMARGWESKDVESQVESSHAEKDSGGTPQKTQGQLDKEREKQGLELSRKRILADLENATNPNHRKLLETTLAHLDEKISSFT